VTLDTNPSTLVKANGLPKHLRIMGLSLQLTFDYRNLHDLSHSGVVCYVTVNVLAQWSQMQPPPDTIWIGDDAQTAKRTRLAFGAAINMKVTGTFKKFSYSNAILALVETVIVFKLPLFVARLISMYFMGIISVIYRRARDLKFNIYTHYRESIAKLVQAEVAFRSLVGGIWRGPVAKKELPMRHLYLHLCDAFDDHMKSGKLSKTELRCMTSAISDHLDYEGDGSIGCGDFVRACTENDIFDLMTVAKVLKGHKHGKDGGIITQISDRTRQTAGSKNGGIIAKLSVRTSQTVRSPAPDSPTATCEEEWVWEDDEPDKAPLDVTQQCLPSLIPAPVAAWDSSSPAFNALRDALQRVEALENLRLGQRLLALEETVAASNAAAKPEPVTPSTASSGQATADGPQDHDLLPRVLLLEKSVAQLGDALDQRMKELQARLLLPKAQSADESKPAAGKLRQVVPTSVDERSGSRDRQERPRRTTNSVPPLMAAMDQAMQAIPPLGRRGSRNVNSGGDVAGGVTPNTSREGQPEQRHQRSGGPGDPAGVRPSTEPSPLDRHQLQCSESSTRDPGEGSSCAARTESPGGTGSHYKMESRIPILGFGESIPIELLDMKEHKRF